MTTICKVDESYINYINKNSSKLILNDKIKGNDNQCEEVVAVNSIESNKTTQKNFSQTETKDSQKLNNGLVHASHDFNAIAYSITLVEVDVEKKLKNNGKVLLLLTEDKLYEKNSLAIRNCIFDDNQQVLKVEIGNFANNDKFVKKSSVLGICEQINDRFIADINLDFESETNSKDIDSKMCASAISEGHKSVLKDKNNIEYKEMHLFEEKVRIGSHLTIEQINELKNLLESIPELFTFKDEKIGRIKGYEHVIDTKDAKPIYCTPSRCSFKEMEIIDREVDRLER
jgi:hypothetical protein